MIKHVDLKSYEYGDVKVMVKIDYDSKNISLVESGPSAYSQGVVTPVQPKNYVFVKRGLEYMNGWRNVLNGMLYAIDEAEKELSGYLAQKEKEKHDDVTEILMKATDMIKSKSLKKKK